MRSSKGFRANTRSKLKKRFGEKFTITPYTQVFKEEDKVIIKIEPSSHKGMPHPRFKGLIGKVVGKRGYSYLVDVKVGKATKQIISRPEHLKLHKA